MLTIRHAYAWLTFWIMLAFIALLASPPALAACDVAGDWQHNTNNVGQSTWKLTRESGNRYKAQEVGLGSATGTGFIGGGYLTINWRTGGGWSGKYEWALDASCTSGSGSLTFYSGGQGTHASHVQRVGSSGMHSGGTHSAGGYWARWVAGVSKSTGTNWATEWTWYDASYVAHFRAEVCGHGVACSCAGRNYCGAYYKGSTAPYWAYGCKRDPIMVRCEVYNP